MTIKLTYFDARARAEALRLAFHIGGVEFEDERLTYQQFGDSRGKDGFASFYTLPVVKIDGVEYSQSHAILRYAGKLSGLYPDDPLPALRVDEITDTCEDIVNKIFAAKGKEGREKFMEEWFPRYFNTLEDLLGSADGPFVLGETLSIADLRLYVLCYSLKKGVFDHVPADALDKYPNVGKCYDAVAQQEKVAQWEDRYKK